MNDKDMAELKEFIRLELRIHTAALYWELSRLPLTHNDRMAAYASLLNGDSYI